MIVPIYIETADIVSQFEGITSNQIDNMLDNIAKGMAAAYARQLEQEANNALHQTRKRYVQNIKLVDTGRLEGTVMLDYSKDKLIPMIEEGADPFDIKAGFFGSSKVKYTKDGRKMLTIPFRWSTPGAVGESDVFSGKMPSGIYRVIKEKETDIPVSGGGTRSKGLTIGEIPEKYQLPGTRSAIYTDVDPMAAVYGKPTFEEYKHRSSLYQGMVKQNDPVTGQNTYHSFRRVSEEGENAEGEKVGSDPDSWIHPGIPMHNLIQVALNNFNQEEELTNGINIELSKLGFNVTE